MIKLKCIFHEILSGKIYITQFNASFFHNIYIRYLFFFYFFFFSQHQTNHINLLNAQLFSEYYHLKFLSMKERLICSGNEYIHTRSNHYIQSRPCRLEEPSQSMRLGLSTSAEIKKARFGVLYDKVLLIARVTPFVREV